MEAESEDDTAASQTSLERPGPHRGNTMVHVCWHRNTSVSLVDFSVAVEVPSKLGPAPPLLPRRFLSLCPILCCILIRLDYLCGDGILLCCNNGDEVGEGRFYQRPRIELCRPFPNSSLWALDQDFRSNIHWWATEQLPYLSYICDLWVSEPPLCLYIPSKHFVV